MYPKEDKENYQVLQFASQAAGSQGLATYVQQISEAAIKVILLPPPALDNAQRQLHPALV